MEIVEIISPVREVAWFPWTVQYFWLVGIAAFVSFVAAIAVWMPVNSQWSKIVPTATVLLVVCAISAPFALLADLHQPGRFWHFYIVLTTWSWMWWGAIFLPCFIGSSFLFGVFWWLDMPKLQRLIALPLVGSAMLIFLYTGAEVWIVRARILWHSFFIPFSFFATAGIGATGGLLIINWLLPAHMRAQSKQPFTVVAAIALALSVITVTVWLISASPSIMYLIQLVNEFSLWRIIVLGFVVYAFFMIMLMVQWMFRPVNLKTEIILAILMVAFPWIYRWVVFINVQGVPKYGAGLYPYSLPLGSEGLMGMLSVFGFVFLMVGVFMFILTLFPNVKSLFNFLRKAHS